MLRRPGATRRVVTRLSHFLFVCAVAGCTPLTGPEADPALLAGTWTSQGLRLRCGLGWDCGWATIEITFAEDRPTGSARVRGLSEFELQNVRLSETGEVAFKAYAVAALDFFFEGRLVDSELRGTLDGGIGWPFVQWADFERTPVSFVRQ